MKLLLKSISILALLILIILIFFLWPFRSFLSFDFLTSQHLLIFTNEAEARPCGGFVTAVGTFQAIPPSISLKNSYALSEPLGLVDPPLTKVADQKYFWDIGVDPNLNICAQEFKNAYAELQPDEEIAEVILIDFATIESVLTIFDTINLNEQEVPTKDIFAALTRTVADIDRHDEEALQNRKRPLVSLTRSLFWKIITHPQTISRISSIMNTSLQNGQIYTSHKSPEFSPSENDIYVAEWNLGGAKTSRSLKKTLKIVAREIVPDQWAMIIKFSAENLGGLDEPLSQAWKGVFEFQMPIFLGGENITETVSLPPGEVWTKTIPFSKFQLPNRKEKIISLFIPRGQKLHTDVSISLFPQKTFAEAVFFTHENIGEFYEVLKGGQKVFSWTENADQIAPFITLHEFVSAEHIADQTDLKTDIPLWVEVHFNEKVLVQEEVSIALLDRDFENEEVTEDPALKHVELLDDQRTLVLGFMQLEAQKNERYYLEISGVRDLWGNKIKPQQRTVIDRR